jgi:hypothetical protein
MNHTAFNRASHFSVIWAVMLCFITLVEWRSLDRDPLKPDILSPFIQRHVQIVAGAAAPDNALPTEPRNTPATAPQYIVELDFNGPLFLACFFIPIILFHGLGLLLNRLHAS